MESKTDGSHGVTAVPKARCEAWWQASERTAQPSLGAPENTPGVRRGSWGREGTASAQPFGPLAVPLASRGPPAGAKGEGAGAEPPDCVDGR